MVRSRMSTVLPLVLAVVSATPAAAQTWRSETRSRQYRGQDFLEVTIKYAVGRFALQEGSDRLLYRIDTKYDEDAFRLRSNYLESEGRGRLGIEIEGLDKDIHLSDLGDREYEGGNLSVDLPGNTPLALHIKLGAAEAKLDLGGLALRQLVYETGASDTQIEFSEPNSDVAEYCTFKAAAAAFRVDDLGNSRCRRVTVSGGVGELKLDFSGDWEYDMTTDINVGLGSVEIRVPADLGVRIEKSTFLMSFDAPDFIKQEGGVYVSGNWEDARHRLTITVSGALGGISIARL